MKSTHPLRKLTSPLWLLGIAVLAFGLFMSQRPRKSPSPAEPGMKLVETQDNSVRNEDKPVVVRPTDPDPNAGDVPDPNAGDTPDLDDDPWIAKDDPTGADDDVPINNSNSGGISQNNPRDNRNDNGGVQAEDDAQLAPALARWELRKVAPGSAIGQSSDWMLVLHGHGFMDGEAPPTVHLGDKISLYEVSVNQRGTVLYALLSNRTVQSLGTKTFNEIAVQNPGGMNRDPANWLRLKCDQAKFMDALQSANPQNYQRGQFFLEEEQ